VTAWAERKYRRRVVREVKNDGLQIQYQEEEAK